MPERILLSRVLRAFGRLLRRLTIGLGALIIVIYYFGDWILAVWPYPACSEWPKSRLANAQGDVAEIAVRGCILGIVNRQYLIRVRPANDSSAKLVVRFKPKELPALHWLDGERRISAKSPSYRRRSIKPGRSTSLLHMTAPNLPSIEVRQSARA